MVECGLGRVLENRTGVVGTGRICGSFKERWNPDLTGMRNREVVDLWMGCCYLQTAVVFVRHHCTGSTVYGVGGHSSDLVLACSRVYALLGVVCRVVTGFHFLVDVV